MDTSATCYVGIDVAKAHLDIAVRPGGQQWTAPNDETGIGALVARVQAVPPALVVLEATGGREMAVAVVNPRQVHDFARAIGQLAKTDALDAQGDRPASPKSSGRSRGRCLMPQRRSSPRC